MATPAALVRVPRFVGAVLVTGVMLVAYGGAAERENATGDAATELRQLTLSHLARTQHRLGTLPPADETVIVLEEPRADTELDRAMMMEDTHGANARGRQLYLQHRYSEAVPYLRAAAKRGFKMAQARLGEILVLGLDDIDQNVEVGMGWMGVAAHGTTLPSIRNRFNELRSHVPVELHPQLASVVSDYIDKYGPDTTRVNCWRYKPVSTQITKMRCGFEDEQRYYPYWQLEQRDPAYWHPG
ncbi:MAG: hypothetical protein OXS50_04105, partial [Gammaproteobacteria bacterium]|nr:hypothetical protein [Gammaproteobacteria bacterium]